MTAVVEKLNKSREDLLDLSLRNTLINYRLLKSKGVTITDELPEELFTILVINKKEMAFLPKPEKTSQGETTDEGDLLEPEYPAERHLDKNLQTIHTATDLQKRLLNTYYAARTYIEEQGVNILYLALGMLEWYESPESNLLRQAPLILLPVELKRTNAQAAFRIRYTEDDLGENLSLQAKLRKEFGIQLPLTALKPDTEDLDISAYFSSISEIIQKRSRWKVNSHAVELGFFSFGTFLMYNDLEAINWFGEEEVVQNPVIEALLGDGFPHVNGDGTTFLQLDESTFIDDYVRPQDSNQVKDADSSQVMAILDVNQGHNLVIQGPPGTGKSQTITNIIAEAIGAQKRVLFVAEKMAALEVVKRRLDEVGLGDACLELHSHQTNKKTLLNDLQRTLDLGKPHTVDGSHDYQALLEKQNQLNAYSRAVNSLIGQSEITPYVAYGKLIQIRERLAQTFPLELELKDCGSWSWSDFQQQLEIVNRLQILIKDIGSLSHHPFWRSQYTTYLPQDKREVERTAHAAEKAVESLQQTTDKLASYLAMSAPKNFQAAIYSLRVAQQMLAAPDLAGINITAAEWKTDGEQIRTAVAVGQRLQTLHVQYEDVLLPEAWTEKVLVINKAYSAYGEKWWRVFSGEFRQAKRELSSLCRLALPKDVPSQQALITAILEAQKLQPVFTEHELLLSRLFGVHWKGEASNWDHIMAVIEWLVTAYGEDRGRLPQNAITYIATHPDRTDLRAVAHSIDEAIEVYRQVVTAAITATKVDEKMRWGENGLQTISLSQQQELFHQWYEQAERVQEMVTYNSIEDYLKSENLDSVIEAAISWPNAEDHLNDLVQRVWYEAVLRVSFQERPLLNRFNVSTHEQIIATFQELDKHQFRLNRQQLVLAHWRKLPKYEASGQLGILRREFEKKSRHKPIRKLMQDAGNAIQAIKPVFMMGPMSIAMYLPPEALDFDLVIFDEASQVRPVNAFGAILRGKQTVVVGDSKQLPPSSFFATMLDEDEPDERIENVTKDMESILGLFVAQRAPQQMLRWHYRSRHESLIAVSNYEFYDNKLVVFPNPSKKGNSYLGLIYRYLPQARYDRGKSSTNQREAEAIAQAVMRHAYHHPDLTLGVAAFSIKQMQAIQDQVERLRRQFPAYESFFAAHPYEPFFVKNLENVQGDERDVILISVGYGHDDNNHLTMNFGPLNKEGGERRLNVLITRARQRCELFTNLKANDIDLNKTNARGIAALKRYLKYAENGQLDIPQSTGPKGDSAFEEIVAAEIRKLGYEVALQVGSAGFFIDLAVKDPERTGRYLLGVECDGANYHSARSARDRDRLRQQVLEGLGWRIYHVWSTDWFQNPTRQIQRLVEALETAKLENKNKVETKSISHEMIVESVEPLLIERVKADTKELVKVVHSYKQAELTIDSWYKLHEMPTSQITEYVTQVVEVESPVHKEEVMRRILTGAGVSRLGARIQSSLNMAIDKAIRQGSIKNREVFLWRKDMTDVPFVRNRQSLSATEQKLKWIAPEEIDLAIVTAVSNAYGISEEEVYQETLALFGFTRITGERKKQLHLRIESLINANRLIYQGNFLKVGNLENM